MSETQANIAIGRIKNFLQLLDAPDTYTGSAGKALIVKAAEDGLEFGATGGGGAAFGTVYFVTPNGNDGTALIGDILKPWKTISAARNQAVTDAHATSLIYVYSGTYEEEELQYDNGNMYLSSGVLIQPKRRINGVGAAMTAVDQGNKKFTFVGNWASEFEDGFKFRVSGVANDGIYTSSTATDVGANVEVVVVEAIPSASVGGVLRTTMACFLIGYTPINAPAASTSTSFNLFGEGTVDMRETLDNDWSGAAIDMLSGTFFGEFDELKTKQGICLSQLGGTATVEGNYLSMYGVSGYCATVRDTANATFRFNRISSTGSWAFFIRTIVDAGGHFFTGKCSITTDEIIQTGSYQPVACSRVGAGGLVIVNCPRIQSDTSYALNNIRQSGGEIIINGNLICDSTGFGTIHGGCTGGDLTVNGNIIIKDGLCIQSGVGGLDNTNAHTFYVNGDIKRTDGGGNAVALRSGSLRLNGAIFCSDGGATDNGIDITSTGQLIVDSLKIITDNEGITASAPRDIIVNHSLASNKALNANITNIVTGSLVIVDANVS